MSNSSRRRSLPPLLFAMMMMCTADLQAQQTETASQRQMAQQMAQQMDAIWDQAPEEGMANVRILMTRNGQPFAGKISIYTEFSFRANRRGGRSSQGFNPNENGRWVFEGLEPGEYQVQVVGSERFEGFEWTENVVVNAGDTPTFEITLP